MATRGQRFQVDLSSDEEETSRTRSDASAFDFVGDIRERPLGAPKLPTAPQVKGNQTGFPAHKKRLGASKFKQQRASAKSDNLLRGDHEVHSPPSDGGSELAKATQADGASFETAERQRIDAENKERIAQMSDAEIEKERRELMAALSPSLIEKLLRRANIDEDSQKHSSGTQVDARSDSRNQTQALKSAKRVPFDLSKEQTTLTDDVSTFTTFDPDSAPLVPPPDLQPPSDPIPSSSHIPSIHFPQAPQPPELDPSNPNFLEELHSKYFPSLPADPSKMAWMAPLPSEDSPADRDSPYHPDQEALSASSIRFSFRGEIIPPSVAREIPVTAGLHHHGLAPEAAGYTIPELARLARSAVPAQRCIAYQTLGRILYRLGKGKFGDEESELSRGLWHSVEQGKVIDTLLEEVNEGGKIEGRRRSHASAKAYATEAVWLWRQGGGKKWKAK